MSAWYILAAMGLHPICPGDDKYEITSPVFNEIVLNLDPKYYPGKQFKILAKNNSAKNIYIQKIELNGKELKRFYLSHQEITNGGTLALTMGPNPKMGIFAPSYQKVK